MLEAVQFADCHRWAKRALAALDPDRLDARVEMELQMCLGLSEMPLGANNDEVRAALDRGLELAERFGELEAQIRLLSALQLLHQRADEAYAALRCAERVERVAAALGDAPSLAVAHSMLGSGHHLIGAQVRAEQYCVAALQVTTTSRRLNHLTFGFEHRNRALCTLARVQWLRRANTKGGGDRATGHHEEDVRLGL